jgi:prevent-host-death family protein
MQVNMHEAKTKLSNLVERALSGEEIIIARDGQPAVQLTPVARKALRPIGLRRHIGLSERSVKASLSYMEADELELWNDPR